MSRAHNIEKKAFPVSRSASRYIGERHVGAGYYGCRTSRQSGCLVSDHATGSIVDVSIERDPESVLQRGHLEDLHHVKIGQYWQD